MDLMEAAKSAARVGVGEAELERYVGSWLRYAITTALKFLLFGLAVFAVLAGSIHAIAVGSVAFEVAREGRGVVVGLLIAVAALIAGSRALGPLGKFLLATVILFVVFLVKFAIAANRAVFGRFVLVIGRGDVLRSLEWPVRLACAAGLAYVAWRAWPDWRREWWDQLLVSAWLLHHDVSFAAEIGLEFPIGPHLLDCASRIVRAGRDYLPLFLNGAAGSGFAISSVSLLLAPAIDPRPSGLRLGHWTGPSVAPSGEGPSRELVVAHISDLHLTADEDTRTVEGAVSPNRAAAVLFDAHREALSKADLLLFTGDLFDSGDPSEYEVFAQLTEGLPRDRTVLVPGNHDLNIVPGKRVRRVFGMDSPGGIVRGVRMARFLRLVDAVQGERATIIGQEMDSRGMTTSREMTLREHLSAHRAALDGFLAHPREEVVSTWGHRLADAMMASSTTRAHVLWRQSFPMAVRVSGNDLVVFVLDSVTPSRFLASNAFGRLDGVTGLYLHQLATSFAGAPRLLALHHHLALPPVALGRAALQARMMLLENPDAVIRFLRSGSATVAFHGHRHIGYVGTLDETTAIVSAASTSIGDELCGASPAISLCNVRVQGSSAVLASMRRLVSA